MNEKSVKVADKEYMLRELTMLESMLADGYMAKMVDGGPTTPIMQLKCYAVCSIRSIDGKPVAPVTSWGHYQAAAQDIRHSEVNGLVDAYISFLPTGEEQDPKESPEPSA